MNLSKLRKKLHRSINKSISRFYDKPLPPITEEEKRLVNELKSRFSEFPNYEVESCSPSEKAWAENANRIKELVLNSNPREFLRWKVISGTMFLKYQHYLSQELKYLKKQPDWKYRWSNAIKECHSGHPIPYARCRHSSGNLIHHAYHVKRFEEETGTKVHKTDFIFEFGGGYGSMCRLFHNLGFNGKYIIFDLETLSAIQEFFLKSIGIKVCSIDSFKEAEKGVVCISDLSLLKNLLGAGIEQYNSMFIATWSISESPIALRNSILPFVSDFQKFLIAYQKQFCEVDNITFFQDWRSQQKHIEWYNILIKHIPKECWYLFGVRQRAD